MKDLQLMILRYSETASDPDSGLKLLNMPDLLASFFLVIAGMSWRGINSSQILGTKRQRRWKRQRQNPKILSSIVILWSQA
jgi:hypothetical protein